MSRLLAKNSAPTRAMLSNAVRRWKSSVHHLRQQQRQLFGSKGAAFKVSSASGGDSSLPSPSPSSLKTSRLLTSPSSSVLLSSARLVHTGTKMSSKFINIKNINSNLITMEYAVRGPLVIRAGEIEKEIAAGKKYPFDEVIRANIGDCHAMGQKPLTHIRQMLALAFDNTLFDSPDIPNDVKRRTELVLKGCQGASVGSYTDSCGLEIVRRQVADYIKARDGFDSDYHNIVITAGASPGIKNILSLINSPVDGKPPSVMIPIPQYPLYSATLAEYGIGQIGYYLDEPTNWGLSIDELQRAVDEARKTSAPRALVVINPGNPTGQVLTLENIKEIIKFAYKEKLLVLADEVYQDNIYDKNSRFHSFKKTIMQMGAPYNELELVSFMSTSKGYLGECGIRGGYMELVNFDPNVQATLVKSITASLCPTTAGQVAVSALVNTPKPGDESYELFVKERDHVLKSLAERADLVYKTFNSFQGFNCNVVQGAMYAFPQITIPPKAIEAAKKRNMEPDAFYAFELLESSGICIVPGSGFKQKPGTYHFRTTILPQTDKLKIMLEKFKKFHESFLKKYN